MTNRPANFGGQPGHGTPPGLSAIILAAGMGKRMKSDLPKVLHEVGDPPRPMVQAVIDACREAGCERIVLVVGHRQELVRAALAGQSDVEFAEQPEQLGTGHAVRCAEHLFSEQVTKGVGSGAGDVFVLAGDGPLIRTQTLRQLREEHAKAHAWATLATSVIDDPSGYGRIVRDQSGAFSAIVEQKDCTPQQLNVREINPSYYCFDVAALFSTLERVQRNPSSGEYYITDVPGMLLAEGRTVGVIPSVPAEDVLSVNTPEQLAEVDRIYRARRAGRVSA